MIERIVTRSVTDPVERSLAGLSPPIRTIGTDSLPAYDRSLPIALCAVAGEVADAEAGSSDRRLDDTLEPVAAAVAMLEGYVRIRRDLLAGERYETVDERDAAVLASDHLHAGAYTVVAEAPVSDRRRLELYRLLTDGSAGLARRFLPWVDGDDSTPDDPEPEALLAATAGELGATAGGGTAETRTAMRRYGRSLANALASHPELDGVRATVARILSGAQRRDADVEPGSEWQPSSTADRDRNLDGTPDPTTSRDRNPDGTSVLDRQLERAREALDVLSDATDSRVSGSPTARLERATRISLQHEGETDG